MLNITYLTNNATHYSYFMINYTKTVKTLFSIELDRNRPILVVNLSRIDVPETIENSVSLFSWFRTQ